MEEVEVSDNADVDGQEARVCDSSAHVMTLVQEAEPLGEGYLAQNIEAEEIEPMVEVDRLVLFRQIVQLALQHTDCIVDEGFRFDDVGKGIAGGEVSSLVNMALRI